ncbi:MAG: arginine repressor [Eubacteriales bacterium]
MKTARQNLILDIIKANDIETQEELANALMNMGIAITQATVSRDIKELNLIKVQADHGRYKYAASAGENEVKNISILIRMFKASVKSIKTAGNIIVIKTLTGSANAAAEAVDNMDLDGLVGTLAGDNTIFIAADTEENADGICAELNELIK